MGERTEELRREIEMTRGDLGQTLDAIGDRVSPGRVIERRKNRITGGFRSAGDRVMGKAHDLQDTVSGAGHDAVGVAHSAPGSALSGTQGAPVTAGVIAFAAGFLLAAVIPPSQTEKAASGKLADKIQPLKDEVTSAAHEVVDHIKEPATQAVEELKSTAADSLENVKDSAKGAAQDTKEKAQTSVETVKDGAVGNT